jgi:hypothetical protein
MGVVNGMWVDLGSPGNLPTPGAALELNQYTLAAPSQGWTYSPAAGTLVSRANTTMCAVAC